MREWVEEFQGSMPGIAGVVAFREPNPGDRKAGAQEILVAAGATHLTYEAGTGKYRVSAGSFFQTNRHLTNTLLEVVCKGQSGDLALDLYAGVGLFSTALARDFSHIVSVEASQTSSGDLSYNRSSNGETVQATTEQYLAGSEASGRVGKGAVLPHGVHKPDLAVVDPPRNGLGERVARMLATLGAPRVVYASCDPATLARDLVILLGSGYRVEKLHLVDLFPQTFHLESVVHLAR
jgi:23S rRNA (uracil1939-C5)-methyltransferase